MHKGLIVSVIVILVLIGGALFFITQPSASTTGNAIQSGNQVLKTSDTQSKSYTVEITSSGFSPQTLSINKGDTVTWINKQPQKSWPASAVHPSHKVYPGSDIAKCGTAEEKNIFDSCGGLAQNEAFSFTFNDIGTWGYHDHLNAKLRGTITVQ